MHIYLWHETMRSNSTLRRPINSHGNAGRSQLLSDNSFNFFPLVARESRTDSWHVDRRAEFLYLRCDNAQTVSNRVVAYWRNAALKTHSVLPDQVGNPNCVLDSNKLNLSQGEELSFFTAMPSPIAFFRFAPASGHGDNESFSPPTRVVAGVDNDFRIIASRSGCIAVLKCEIHVFNRVRAKLCSLLVLTARENLFLSAHLFR